MVGAADKFGRLFVPQGNMFRLKSWRECMPAAALSRPFDITSSIFM